MVRIVALLVAATGLSLPVVAAGNGSPPAQTAPAGRIAARRVFDALVQRYGSLRSYRDVAVFRQVITVVEQGGEPGEQVTPWQATLAFEAPNRVALRAQPAEVYCDGRTLWQVREFLGQYTEQPVHGPLCEQLGIENTLLSRAHPVLTLLLAGHGQCDEALPGFEPQRVRPETRDGRQYTVVSGPWSPSGVGIASPTSCELWIDPDRGLLARAVFDITESFRPFAGVAVGKTDPNEAAKVELERAVWTVELTQVRTDGPLPDDTFRFVPREDLRQVESFTWQQRPEDNRALLIGRPAPPIRTTTLDGTPFDLGAQRGKVVVMDFWATWCGPCVKALPHVQKLYKRYHERGVVFVGINGDGPGTAKRVRRFLNNKGITFPQVLDADGAISRRYHVRAIPCTVLIDRDGNVADVHTGFVPGQQERIATQIDRLLAGKPLYTPGQIEQMRAAHAAEHAPSQRPPTTQPDESRAPLRLGWKEQAADRLHARGGAAVLGGNPLSLRDLDVDGDGVRETVIPRWNAQLAILSADGREVRTVSLRGLGMMVSLWSVDIARIGGRRCWVVGYVRSRVDGLIVGVGLFEADGRQRWKYERKLPRGWGATPDVAAGDLDGDGRVEIAVSLRSYRSADLKDGQPGTTRGEQWLLILSADGKLLAQKRIRGARSYRLRMTPPDANGRQTILWFGFDGVRQIEYTPARSD